MVVLRYFEGCPNVGLARERLDAAIGRLGAGEAIVLEAFSAEAATGETAGSPTILIDGRDPFPSAPGGNAASCRMYETPDGLQGSPSVDQLVEALRDPERPGS